MNFIEFLGFIIALFAMAFLFAKRVSEERRRRLHPEEFEYEQDEEERAVQELLESLNIPVEPPAKKSSLKPVISPPRGYAVQAPPVAQPKAIDVFAPKEIYYQLHMKKTSSRVQELVRRVPSAKDMVLYREILGEPKGFRNF